jgi:hypothetical protein
MAASKMEFELQATGGDATANEIKKVKKAVDETKVSTNELARANEDSIRRFNGLRAIAGSVGQALERLDPQIGKVVQGLQGVAQGAIQGAAAFGPWGAAVGGLTAALPFLIEALSDTKGAMSETALAARQLATDFESALSRVQALDRAMDVRSRRSSGRLSSEEARAFELQAQSRTSLARGGFQSAFENNDNLSLFVDQAEQDRIFNAAARGDRDEAIRRLSSAAQGRSSSVEAGTGAIDALVAALEGERKARVDVVEALNREAREGAERVMNDVQEVVDRNRDQLRRTIDSANRGGGGGGNAAEVARAERAERERLLEIKSSEFELDQKRLDLAREELDALKERADKLDEITAQEREQAEEAIELFRERYRRERDAENDLARERESQAQKEKELLGQQTSMRGELIDLTAQGADVLLEAFNASEGPKAAISAAIEVARAVSDFASFNYVGGAGHLLSAALFGVQAAKMGHAADSGAGAAQPVAPSNQSAASGGSSLVINYNAPQSSAEVGEMQRRNERAMHARFGA